MKKLGIVLGAVFVIVVSPFVVQYGWNEIITTIIPVMTGKSSVLVPTRTKRKYILIVSGYAGNKQVEETFEVTAEEYKYYEIGNNFTQNAVSENEGGEEND